MYGTPTAWTRRQPHQGAKFPLLFLHRAQHDHAVTKTELCMRYAAVAVGYD